MLRVTNKASYSFTGTSGPSPSHFGFPPKREIQSGVRIGSAHLGLPSLPTAKTSQRPCPPESSTAQACWPTNSSTASLTPFTQPRYPKSSPSPITTIHHNLTTMRLTNLLIEFVWSCASIYELMLTSFHAVWNAFGSLATSPARYMVRSPWAQG